MTLGEPDGGVVGMLLGFWEGVAEGSAEGSDEGAEVGIKDGALVTEGGSEIVGRGVGITVGSSVGEGQDLNLQSAKHKPVLPYRAHRYRNVAAGVIGN